VEKTETQRPLLEESGVVTGAMTDADGVLGRGRGKGEGALQVVHGRH
jgi:hypothetical protein